MSESNTWSQLLVVLGVAEGDVSGLDSIVEGLGETKITRTSSSVSGSGETIQDTEINADYENRYYWGWRSWVDCRF